MEDVLTPWLIVEDEEDIRNIIKVMFGVWGHDTLEFRDGNQAFKWLDEVEAGSFKGELPELALLDIRMPGPRGNEIARRMRTLKAFEKTPIVLMTAFTLTDSDRQAMFDQDGVDHILAKPLPDLFTFKQILDDIHTKKQNSTPPKPAPTDGDAAVKAPGTAAGS